MHPDPHALSVRSPAAGQWGGLGLLASLPWCCLVPAGLSVAGAAGSAVARAFLGPLTPWFALVAFVGLFRANYLAWYRRRGSGWGRVVVTVSTVFAIALWLPRWWP